MNDDLSASDSGRAAPVRSAVVDLAAFRHNVRTLIDIASPAKTLIAVKADAYGHGMLPIATAALDAGADALGVLDIPAALALRAAGITAPIFAWMHDADADFGAAIAADIDLGVSALWQLERIDTEFRGTPPRVHLKVDTGLSRNGATEAEWPTLVTAALAAESRGALTVHAAWSHLADASPADDRLALQRFRAAVDVAESLGARFELLHLAASSAGIDLPEARLGMVRFGIAAYGISPFEDRSGADLGLRPVMTLRSTVALVKRVPAGHGVSYGFIHTTTAPTTLALVPLGYADGIPRRSSGHGEVWIAGSRHPVVGRVAMDQIVVDVGNALVREGDEVVVFGDAATGAPTAEDWAGYADTIGDEIVARIGPRVRRDHVHGLDLQALDGAVLHIPDSASMHELGRAIGRGVHSGDTVLLSGELGAGKTTLTQGIGAALGVRGPITSPTFVLARSHPAPAGRPPLVHVDAYRLSEPAELDDLDIDFTGSVTVIEWGKGLVEPLVAGYWDVAIERQAGEWSEDVDDDPRTVTIRRVERTNA